ncbi:MAG: C1 family peptidase [Nitrospirota bacterium]
MKKRSWKVVSLAAVSSLFLLTAFSAVALAGGETLTRAPMNPAYARYLAKKKAGTWHLNLAKGHHGLGRLPNRIDRSYLLTAAKRERTVQRAAAIRRGSTYSVSTASTPFTRSLSSVLKGNGITSATLTTGPPTSYDLRKLGKIGPVEDQGDAGSCWDFAALASLESTLPKTVAFSENDLLDSDGFDWGPNDGGLDSLSMAYLTRCGVPKSETQYPYQYQWTWAPLADTSIAQPAIRVQDVYMIPPDEKDIKQAIWASKAALTLSFYYDDSLYYQNAPVNWGGTSSTATDANFFNPYSTVNQYQTDLPNGGGHEVTVIGWNDSYPASNFKNSAGAVPPGNGAYLCRNQWGPYWGSACGTSKYDNQGGYFYISYYDKSIANYGGPLYLYEHSPAGLYNQVYQYDPLGNTYSWGWQDPSTGAPYSDGYMANVFKADKAGGHVKAVGFYVNDYSVSYEIQIYENPIMDAYGNIADPTSGTLVYDQYNGYYYTGNALTSVPAGFHTIKLNKAVPVTPGENFSVVVYLNDDNGYPYPWAVEDQEPGYSDRAFSTTNQSYDSHDGVTWGDLYNDDSYTDPTTGITTYYYGNACIKAYAAP